MGFRNPATSAAAVDTRTTAAGAGVRIIQDNSTPAAPRGLVVFTDGFVNDNPTPARVYQHSEANTRGDGFSQGGGLTLDGGTYGSNDSGVGGLAAPKLDLFVAPDGAGGITNAAALTGGPLTVDRPIIASGAGEQWQDLPFGPAWAAWDTTANMPRFRRDAAAQAHVRGMVKLVTGQSIAAGATLGVCQMPSGYFLPATRAWRSAVVLNASGFFVAVVPAWVESTGVLTVYNVTASAFTAGFGVSLGLSFPTT